MKTANIPTVKLGVVAVSRDCFPIALSTDRKNCDILDKIRRNIELLAAGDEGFKSLALQFDIS